MQPAFFSLRVVIPYAVIKLVSTPVLLRAAIYGMPIERQTK